MIGMCNMFPIVSAIVSTYNSERFLRGRLDDLLNQTIGNSLEVIVVNSGSQQNENIIIKEYTNRYPNIKSIETPYRETIYQAWNRGIKLATGKYITNANADDRLHPKALEILMTTMETNPRVGLVYADQYISSEANASYNGKEAFSKMRRPDFSRLRLLAGHIVGPQAIWRASIHHHDKIWFDDRFEVAGDYDFVCRVAEKHEILHLPSILGSYYLAKDKSNKEHQDNDVTANETADIQLNYAKQFIESLDEKHQKKLKMMLSFYLSIPSYIHTGVFRLSKSLFPRNYILPRAFVSWMSALLCIKEGDKNTAVKLCKSCLHYPRAATARRLLQELVNSGE
jgi:glycosyltransferase involved in cell wall biosynthesis